MPQSGVVQARCVELVAATNDDVSESSERRAPRMPVPEKRQA